METLNVRERESKVNKRWETMNTESVKKMNKEKWGREKERGIISWFVNKPAEYISSRVLFPQPLASCSS